MIVNQAVILAGGFGTRLGERSINTPKPMQLIAGKPFLSYLLWNLKRNGITKIIISVGYLSSKIIEYFEDGTKFDLEISYIKENEPLGTAGPLKLCRNRLDTYFFLLNGDTIFDINYHELSLLLIKEKGIGAISLLSEEETSRYGLVNLNDSKVVSFNEKKLSQSGLINGGVSVFNNKLLDYIDDGPCSLEKDIFPKLIKEGSLLGKDFDGFFIDIGIPETLSAAQTLLPKWKKKDAFFLDRDGVINIDYGHVCSPERFKFTNGAIKAVKRLNDLGKLVIIITNQAGIAKGFYTENQFKNFMQWINSQLQKKGAHFDAYYYCPHHPYQGDMQYRKNCNCRKPKSGMFELALEEWELEPNKCVMIGDKESDLLAAKKIGVKGYLFNANEESLDQFVLDKLIF